MEIIIAIVVVALGAMFYFNRKPKVTVSTESSNKLDEVNAVPYTVVETPAVVEVDQSSVVAAAEASATTTGKKVRKPRTLKAEKPAVKKAPVKVKAAKATAKKPSVRTTKSKKV
jgi:hypothetical protein